MSTKLFYENPYLSEWTAEIQSIEQREEKYLITLNKTFFYPEGGGQPCDKGNIDGIEIVDIFEEEGIIFHVLGKRPEGINVNCVIDFERRFDHMQQHSGEHLLSGVFYTLFKGQNMGFHMGEDYVTIDISIADITEEMLMRAEDIACSIIYKNIDINTYITKDSELLNLPLRKACKVKGDIRIVEIGDVDCIACCGTHVRKTGEIGIIKIIKTEKYKGMTRVYFKCGRRAQKDYQNKQNIITSLSRLYLAQEDQVFERARSEADTVKIYEKEIKRLKDTILGYEAEDIVKLYTKGLIVKKFENKSLSDLQVLSKLVLDKGSFTVIFCSIPEKKLSAASNEQDSIVFGRVFKETLQRYNGRGGGSDKQAQAGFQNTEDMVSYSSYLEKLIEELKG